MGRSVSYAAGSVAICYRDVSHFGQVPVLDENGDETETMEHDDFANMVDWDLFVEDLQEQCAKAFPSMSSCDKWLGREDHAIVENDYAYIGVSEYCGLVSIWLAPKDSYDNGAVENRAEHWLVQVTPKFNKLFSELRRVATFSNGESQFERVA